MPGSRHQRRSPFRLARILIGAGLMLISWGGAQAENGKIYVNPYEKKPFMLKEPVPQRPARHCFWQEGGARGTCPVGPSTPIGSSCECLQTVEHKVTRHVGKVIAQQ
jgi:hypothetical protein